ncbi:hypothetical protein LTR95_018848, partial [Oleoguttula sp. CCFEE 5521]
MPLQKRTIGEMEPPAYTAPTAAPTPTLRTINDLRSQIIANASVLKPRHNEERSRADHIEVVVARLPSTSSTLPTWVPDEKVDLRAKSEAFSKARSSAAVNAGMHYALLTKRTTSKSEVQIILRGAAKPTIEEALEDVLERTEALMHDHVLKYGTAARDG